MVWPRLKRLRQVWRLHVCQGAVGTMVPGRASEELFVPYPRDYLHVSLVHVRRESTISLPLLGQLDVRRKVFIPIYKPSETQC